MIKNGNQKLAVKGKKLKNLAVLYTVEFYRGSLLPIPISESDKLSVQRRTIRQTEQTYDYIHITIIVENWTLSF